MAQSKFNRLAFIGYNIVQTILTAFGLQQIFQTVLGIEAVAVEIDAKSAVQIGVHPHPALNIFRLKHIIGKKFAVRNKTYAGAVLIVAFAFAFGYKFTATKLGLSELTFAHGSGNKKFGKRIDRLGTDAVQAYRKLEYIVIIFPAGIHYRNAFNQFSRRNAAAVVAHGNEIILQFDVDSASGAHDKFVDTVIDYLFEQDIYTVIRIGTVAHAPDIHTGAETDMLQRA